MSSGPIDDEYEQTPEEVVELLNAMDREQQDEFGPLAQLQHDMTVMMSGFGQVTRLTPDTPSVSADELDLRINLIREEAAELVEALEDGDMVGIAKEIIDVLVVTIGTANCLGITLDPLWNEVQKSNLAKQGGPVREDGKHLKPEGWKPPDILSLLIQQGWINPNDKPELYDDSQK